MPKGIYKRKPFTEKHKQNMKKPKSELHRKHISIARKILWKNVDYKNNQVKSLIKNLQNPIFPYEQKYIKICKENNFPFIFVGNGDIIIEGFIPDFIESNGKKLIVEIHATTNKNYENIRNKIFSKCGYKTLFLYWKDFKQNLIIDKTKNFILLNGDK